MPDTCHCATGRITFSCADAVVNLQREAKKREIDPDRLVIADMSVPKPKPQPPRPVASGGPLRSLRSGTGGKREAWSGICARRGLYNHARRTGDHAKGIMLRVRVIGIAVVRYPRETEFLIKSLADLFMDTPLFNAHTTVHSPVPLTDLTAAAVPAPL